MVQEDEIDRNTALCLACSCSLPPLKKSGSHPSTSAHIFLTPCCRCPICPACITANPRLQRYNPCLACLSGVGLVRSSSGTVAHQVREKALTSNIDGAVRDEDTFVLGDADDDEEDDPSSDEPSRSGAWVTEQPAHSHTVVPLLEGPSDPVGIPDNSTLTARTGQPPNTNDAAPSKYYIKRNDTLQGIALRYGLNGHELCRSNDLPPSTLRTTPHFLHTRRYLILPPSARQLPGLSPDENEGEVRERDARIQRERAEKRLQTLTKEIDWHVAKAYVTLADDTEETEEYERKGKEGGLPGGSSSNLEERAIGRYLDDEDWEANVRRDGGKVGLTGLPFINGWDNSRDRTARSEKEVQGHNWWKW